MTPESLDRLELKDLQLPDSFLKVPQPASNSECRHRSKSGNFRFYQFPIKVLDDIAKMTGASAPLIVLLVLYRLYFHSFRQNPVRLTSESLRKYNISRHQKRRALNFLEKTGHITVQRQHRKNPLVTLSWLPRIVLCSLGDTVVLAGRAYVPYFFLWSTYVPSHFRAME